MRKLLFRVMLGGIIAVITSTWGYANMPTFPSLVNYQGMLTDEVGNPLTGTYDLTFAIYDDTTGGTLKWKETQEGVQVQNGLFNVALGKVSALNLAFNQWYWLQVGVGEENMPRIRFTSVGYAYRALRADSANVALSAPNTSGWTDNGAVVRLTTNSDSVGIGTANPTSKLQVTGMIHSSSGGFKFPDNTIQTTASTGSGTITSVVAGNGLTGGGSSGSVTLNVNPGAGVSVLPDTVKLDKTYTDNLYVNTSGDDMTGTLNTPQLNLGSTSQNGLLQLYRNGSGNPVLNSAVWADGSALQFFDESHNKTIEIAADNAGSGGYFYVARSTGSAGFEVDGNYTGTNNPVINITGASRSATFNLNNSGDASVTLPTDAISSSEILDEPGIAANYNQGPITLPQDQPIFQYYDLVTASITIPTSGYLYVEGRSTFRALGTTGRNVVYAQIDTGAGIGDWTAHYIEVGLDSYVSTSFSHFPFYVNRIYFKPAGTYTYHLVARADGGNGAGAISRMLNSFITITFYPTSYGSVSTVVAGGEVGEFANAVPVDARKPAENQTTYYEQYYQVDLRELELKAAKARAEAERAERELLEAELAKQQQTMERLKKENNR